MIVLMDLTQHTYTHTRARAHSTRNHPQVFDEYTGPVQMKLDKYAKYAAAAKEERPLYLFEPWFAGKVAQFDRDYTVRQLRPSFDLGLLLRISQLHTTLHLPVAVL